jgi:hypothetical protein
METTLTTPDVAPQMAAQVEAMPIEVVRHVLWHFGDVVLGEEPGGFVSALLTTMGRADKANFQEAGRGVRALRERARSSRPYQRWARPAP